MQKNPVRSDTDTKDKAASETGTHAQNERMPKAAAKEKSGIAYQNKDIFAKIFGEGLKEKSFAAYGLNVPKIAEVLPTNLPAVEANELRLDNLFRFADYTENETMPNVLVKICI